MTLKPILTMSLLALLGLATGCGTQLSPANTLLQPPPPTPCVPTTAVQRVNCGDAAFSDSCGNLWAADQAYTLGGWGYVTPPTSSVGGVGTGSIGGTVEDGLFLKERYAASLEYRFTVPNATYQVTMKFCEGYFTGPGQRSFGVVAEGVNMASGLDLYAQAGPKNAYELSSPVTVSDGILNIVMTASADNALVNAIEIK